MDYEEVYPMEIRQGYAADEMCVLVLYAPGCQRNVPILIGRHEAEMIMLEREGMQARRPMTHELIESLFEAFALELKEVTIDRFEEGIFYATLYVSDGFNVKKIDSRASDAIVLALREEVAIKMATKVLEETGYEDTTGAPMIPNPSTDDNFEEMSIEELERLLKKFEDAEEYEMAADILEYIKQKKKSR